MNSTMNQNFARDLDHMLYAAERPGERTGFSNNFLTRFVIDVDPITNEKTATLYTEDGDGNGVGLFSVPFDMMKLFVLECDIQAAQMAEA